MVRYICQMLDGLFNWGDAAAAADAAAAGASAQASASRRGGRVLLTEILSPRVEQLPEAAACLISTGG